MIDEATFKKLTVFLIIGVLIVLSFLVMWPLLIAVLIGFILSYIFYPLYSLVLKLVRQRTLSALIIIFFVLFLIFLPIWFLFPIFVRQIFEVYLYMQKVDFTGLVVQLFPSLANTPMSANLAGSFNNFISGSASALFLSTSSLITNVADMALKTLVVFFVFFYGMRDSKEIRAYVRSLSPFSSSLEKDLSQRFTDITKAVIYGHIIIGIIQGILTGIGLYLFGVPGALFLTLVAVIAAMIPVLGSWLVWIPAGIYLLVIGSYGAGIGMLLYGAIFVSWIDNIIRPYIISMKSNLSTGVVMVGMIGGLIMFGFMGLILGPLILSYLLILLDAYRKKQFGKIFYNEE